MTRRLLIWPLAVVGAFDRWVCLARHVFHCAGPPEAARSLPALKPAPPIAPGSTLIGHALGPSFKFPCLP